MFNIFFSKKYFKNITDEVIDNTTPSLYLRELKKNYYKCHYY